MATQNSGPGSPPDPEVFPLESPMPEWELDEYGVAVQKRQMDASTRYQLALVSVACAIVPIGLALHLLIGRHKPSNLALLGMIPAVAAALIGGGLVNGPDKRGGRIARAGLVLGILGFFAVVIASGHGAALGDGG